MLSIEGYYHPPALPLIIRTAPPTFEVSQSPNLYVYTYDDSADEPETTTSYQTLNKGDSVQVYAKSSVFDLFDGDHYTVKFRLENRT